MRLSRRLAASLALLISANCTRDGLAPANPSFSLQQPNGDPEVYGVVYENGVRSTRTNLTVTLDPLDAETANRLRGRYDNSMWVNPASLSPPGYPKGRMFGWYDPRAGDNCGALGAYLSGDTLSRHPEVHATSATIPAPPPEAQVREAHCIRPGRYRFTLAGPGIFRTFDIEYIAAVDGVGVSDAATGTTLGVEPTAYDTSDGHVDFTVNVDLNTVPPTTMPVLRIQNALTAPMTSSFEDDSSLQVNETHWLRFSSHTSTGVTWALNPSGYGRVLARYSWDVGHAQEPVYFIDDRNQVPLLRIHRYTNISENRNVTVGLELMQPNHEPANLPVAQRSFAFHRAAPFPCATVEATSTWSTTDQVLSAACSGQGPSNEYRWRSSTSAPWSSWSPSPLFEFPGHSSAGSPIVAMEVRNSTTGAASQQTLPFTVTGSQIVLDGSQWITAKTTYTYTSNHTLWWHERFDPDPTWYPSPEPARATTTRTWYAGNYTVGLRQQTGSGPLGRGRLDITVCIPCGPGDPLAPGITEDSSWSIFGAGPWLSWGDGNSLRFYDLLGVHQVANSFTERAWLDADSGRGSPTGAGRLITWRRRRLELPNSQAVDFAVDATAEAMTFGFAVDPDLGSNAADDATGYDAARGMVYVWDGERAVGFLLRDATGADALQGVTQYGLNRRHPVASRDVWSAQRRAGVSLLSGRSDVQLLLTAPARQGALRWTLLMVRGRSPAELRSRADAAIAALN